MKWVYLSKNCRQITHQPRFLVYRITSITLSLFMIAFFPVVDVHVIFLPLEWRHWELSPWEWQHWELFPLWVTSVWSFSLENDVNVIFLLENDNTESFLLFGWRQCDLSPLRMTSLWAFPPLRIAYSERQLSWRTELALVSFIEDDVIKSTYYADDVTSGFIPWEWRRRELKIASLRAFPLENDVTESFLLFSALYNVEETVLLNLKSTYVNFKKDFAVFNFFCHAEVSGAK